MEHTTQASPAKSSKKQNLVQKIASQTSRWAKDKPLIFLAILAILAGGFTLLSTDASGGDCSANDIIKCGGFSGKSGTTPSQAQVNSNVAKYHNATEISNIYKHYGIDYKSLGGLPLGEVHADGRVTLNGNTVATGARSSGRQNISNSKGSSKQINSGGTVFYERSTTVSFRSGKLQAWVKLDSNGRFMWAVISGCGNPVVATPTKPPEPVGALACKNITQQALSRDKYRFSVAGTVSGEAKLTSYAINYGDGKTDTKSTSAGTVTFDHTYTTPGAYTVKAGVSGTLGSKSIGDGVNPACAVAIKVESPPVPNYSIKKYVKNQDAQNNNSAVTVKPGQQFVYKIVVANTGQTDLKNIKAWDVLPSGVKFVDGSLKLAGASVSDSADFFQPNKGINIPSLAKGASVEITFNALIEGGATEVTDRCNLEGIFYNNVAKADPEGSLGEKQDPAVIKCKTDKDNGVDIEKDVTQYENPVGGNFNWVLKVTNNGNSNLKNVKVTDSAPDGTEFTGADKPEGIEVNFTPTAYNAVIAELKAGESRDLIINARVTKFVSGEITNTACVDAPEVTDQGPNPAQDDCDDAKITIPEPCPIPGKETLGKTDAGCGNTPPVPITPSTGAGEVLGLTILSLLAGAGIYYYSLKTMKKN